VAAPTTRPNAVVLMAGGLGTRLRPLTETTPKPLLRVGGRPLLETIVESFADHGFTRFFLSINYRADQVEAYFGDGSQLGVEVDRVPSLVEKPTARHFVNAGIYVLAPSLIANIRRGERLDMTDLAQRVMAGNGRLSAFPIREYWLDIGHLKDYERAQADFAR